jgi:hypothetical protein
MSATLPTEPAGHITKDSEWLQVLNAITRITNVAVFASQGGCTLSTTSSSYVDITGASTSWTKTASSADSDVVALVALDIYPSGAGSTAGMVAMSIGGTDTDVLLTYLSSAGVIGGTRVGFKAITGLGAAAYTPKLRAKRTSGTATLVVDSLVNVSFLVGELPK